MNKEASLAQASRHLVGRELWSDSIPVVTEASRWENLGLQRAVEPLTDHPETPHYFHCPIQFELDSVILNLENSNW